MEKTGDAVASIKDRRIPTVHRFSFLRTICGTACYSIEMLGAALLFFRATWGLSVATVAMVVSFSIMISGSWLLLGI